jgi:cystathionine beta-lyase
LGEEIVFDFDEVIDRSGTASVKFDARKAVFGRADVTPLWVADMDFSTPSCVKEALIKRAQHPIFGYTLYPKSLYQSLITWFKQRHRWEIKQQEILMCPGVVPSMHAVILALTSEGDKVIVQPPVYPPFFSAVSETNRTLVLNPLSLEGDHYIMDFDHLEVCAKEASLLLLCSPHNPTGRVWREAELMRLLDIAERYGLTILSDEIHADLVFHEHRHLPLASLSKRVKIITAVSPSKTFNIPGLGLSSLIFSDPEQKKSVQNVFEQWHVSACNPFSIVAFEAAYAEGGPWLDALLQYLKQTKEQVKFFFQLRIPQIKVIDSDGTYLLWLDCRALNLSDDALKSFFIETAGLGLNPGLTFGQAGSGFMRLNIASPRSVIMKSCLQLASAIEAQ